MTTDPVDKTDYNCQPAVGQFQLVCRSRATVPATGTVAKHQAKGKSARINKIYGQLPQDGGGTDPAIYPACVYGDCGLSYSASVLFTKNIFINPGQQRRGYVK